MVEHPGCSCLGLTTKLTTKLHKGHNLVIERLYAMRRFTAICCAISPHAKMAVGKSQQRLLGERQTLSSVALVARLE